MAATKALPVKRRRGPPKTRSPTFAGDVQALKSPLPQREVKKISSIEALKDAFSDLCQSLLDEFKKATLSNIPPIESANASNFVPFVNRINVVSLPIDEKKTESNAVISLSSSENEMHNCLAKKKPKRAPIKKIAVQRKKPTPPPPPSFLPSQIEENIQTPDVALDIDVPDVQTADIDTEAFNIDPNFEHADKAQEKKDCRFDATSSIQNDSENSTMQHPKTSENFVSQKGQFSQRTRLGAGLKLPPPPPFPIAPAQKRHAFPASNASKGEKLRQAIAALSSDASDLMQSEQEMGDPDSGIKQCVGEDHINDNLKDGIDSENSNTKESSLGSPILKMERIDLKEGDDISKILESPVLIHSSDSIHMSPVKENLERASTTLCDDSSSAKVPVTSPTGVPIWKRSNPLQSTSPLRLSPAANRKRPSIKEFSNSSLKHRTHAQELDRQHACVKKASNPLAKSLDTFSRPLGSSSNFFPLDCLEPSKKPLNSSGAIFSKYPDATTVPIASLPNTTFLNQKENLANDVNSKSNGNLSKGPSSACANQRLPLELFSASRAKLDLLGANSPKEKSIRPNSTVSPMPKTASQTISKIKNKVAALLSSSTRVASADMNKAAAPHRSKQTPVKTPIGKTITPVSLKAISSSCVKHHHQPAMTPRSPALTPITRTRGTKPSECRPTWVITPNLRKSLASQSCINPESIFGNIKNLSLERKQMDCL